MWGNSRSTRIWLRSARNTCGIVDKILNGIGRSRQSGRIYQLWVTAFHLLQHGQEATKILPHAARPVLREPTDLYHIEKFSSASFTQWCGVRDKGEQDATHLILQYLKTTGKNSISPAPSCIFFIHKGRGKQQTSTVSAFPQRPETWQSPSLKRLQTGWVQAYVFTEVWGNAWESHTGICSQRDRKSRFPLQVQ